MYDCSILADSISDQGYRLTTFRVTFPRFILAEVNTHRMFSRNSASSRAVPTEKVIGQLLDRPFVPQFNKRVKGMGVGEALSTSEQQRAESLWLELLDNAVHTVEALGDIDKSRANRLLEPFKWHTAIISATDWYNFFELRNHPSAQPEFQTIASMMQDAYHVSNPRELAAGDLHLPLVSLEEIDDEALAWPEPFIDWEMWAKVSIGRVAGVSYERTENRSREEDIALHDRLRNSTPPHLSPFEHVARPFYKNEWGAVDAGQNALHSFHDKLTDDSVGPEFIDRLCRNLEYCGNFHGWIQHRALIHNEHDASLMSNPFV